jgi:tRNA (guanine-N7-)-methyltransferase
LIRSASISLANRELSLGELLLPLPLASLLPGQGPWEVELGFGKGRFLLEQAAQKPGVRFLGIEVASTYYRLVRKRARRRELANLILMRGEALYLVSTALPTGFAAAVHVYFPDPWPKSRHHKRRLFDVETVDLVIGLLEPGGRLYFATDFLDYGDTVGEILAGFPGLAVDRSDGPRREEPLTHYEARYRAQGHPILYLEATLGAEPSAGTLHPEGAHGVVAATWKRKD